MRAVMTMTLLALSCFKTVSVGQKTSLEAQLMGQMEPLSEEELLLSTVRGVSVSAHDPHPKGTAARRRQLFNRDDVDELKRKGCLGEALDARLVARECKAEADMLALRDRLIDEENADRQSIIDWVMATDTTLSPEQRPQIVVLYRQLLISVRRDEDWIQEQDGSWRQRRDLSE